MVDSARSPRNDQSHSIDRRNLLCWLGAGSLGLLMAACSGSIPPRQYDKPTSHITGGRGKG